MVAAAHDYRGNAHEPSMQDTLADADVVLMVDDWAERGSQAAAVRQLVELAGARFAGLSLIVDQLNADTRRGVVHVTALVVAADLVDPDA